IRNGLWSIVVGGVVGALLWAGPVGAQTFPGGLPECVRQLNTCTSNLTQTQGQLSTCTTSLTQTQGQLSTCTRCPFRKSCASMFWARQGVKSWAGSPHVALSLLYEGY